LRRRRGLWMSCIPHCRLTQNRLGTMGFTARLHFDPRWSILGDHCQSPNNRWDKPLQDGMTVTQAVPRTVLLDLHLALHYRRHAATKWTSRAAVGPSPSPIARPRVSSITRTVSSGAPLSPQRRPRTSDLMSLESVPSAPVSF
jgi:hypothetical protein